MTDFQPDAKLVEFVMAFWPDSADDPEGLSWDLLCGDGSDRSFFRVRFRLDTALVVQGLNRAENRSYELIGRHLWALEETGPKFMAVDQKQGLFLIEDLGDVSLQDFIRGCGASRRDEIYKRVISVMADLHYKGTRGFRAEWCFQTPAYDKALILEREAGYFTHRFLEGYLKITPPAPGLGLEFEALADAALKKTETVLMHRDFQSRNVMIKQEKPRLIDFQGARFGPPGYDLASLLYDPYVELSERFRKEMRGYYIQLRKAQPAFDEETCEAGYHFLAVCRLLQALGAFAFLSQVKGKALYLQYVPPAVRTLKKLLDRDEMFFLPELQRTVNIVYDAIEDGS
ncbi:MAG: phosphotransferase [Deltaproteobacteria bacterium]|nr:phosphotransferase [Deltaproteobacteria bacterium]MBW2051246.1 phosphotransferase [Deltaproteobacteria bacterium]MBW2140314.1 phosphotransferase [Deltaproteobacteria bacterium]MBW2323546.1 phosphotransferase [Deltaproteobacteria bacterium]